MIRQFAFHDGVSKTAPEVLIKTLHDKCEELQKKYGKTFSVKLTPAEKQQIFDYTYHYKGVHKLLGWEFNFRPFMKRFIVNSYGNWHQEYAFTKINIHKNIFTRTGVIEIHEIPNLTK